MRALLFAVCFFLTVPAFGCTLYQRLSGRALRMFHVLFPPPDPHAPQSDRRWEKERENWEREVKGDFYAAFSNPAWSFEKLRDSDIAFFEENLGFKFNLNRTKVTLPSREVFLQKYRELMERYVREGTVTPEEVLMPGNVFQVLKGDGQGKIHIIPADNRPLNGWSPVSPSPSPRLYTRMLREGYHPFDDGSFHDSVGHMLGFARYPKYMAAMRKLAGSPPIGIDKMTQNEWTLRYLYLLEGFSLMPASSRPNLEANLAPIFHERGTPEVFTEEVEGHYRHYPEAKLKEQGSRLITLYERLAEKYGGSAMEIGAMGYYHRRAEMRQTLYGLASTVEEMISSRPSEDPNAKESLPRAIANLEVALWRSSFIPMEKFIEDFTKFEIPRSSPVFGYFVGSGISYDVPYFSYQQQKLIQSHGLVARSITQTMSPADLEGELHFQDYSNLGRDKKRQIIVNEKK